MAAGEPLSIDKMLTLFVEEKEPPTRDAIKQAIKVIEEESESRGVELKKVSSGYRFQAKKDFAPWVSRLWEEKPARYSRALLETLVLIAYKQPITRGEIEHVRGVAVSTNIIKTLLEREWVRVVGHRDVPGKPALYATTKAFLDYFNLTSLEQLPTLAEIRDLDKINAELDLQEPGAEPAEMEEEAADIEELAEDVVSDADEESEQVIGDQPVDEPSVVTQSEESLSVEELSEEEVSTTETSNEETSEDISDEEIDSNQDDRDDVMLDEHDREIVSRLSIEEEEIIASVDSSANDLGVSESSAVDDQSSQVDDETPSLNDSGQDEHTLSVDDELKEDSTSTVMSTEESDDYTADEDFDSKFAS